jgi:DNA-binding transcriptional ArsR family regulator
MASPKTYHHPDLDDVSLATAMQALADPCRVAIVRTLCSDQCREFACNEIVLDISKATVSHHFEALREAGIILTRVEGRKCLSSIRKKEFNQRFPGLLELVLSESASSNQGCATAPL